MNVPFTIRQSAMASHISDREPPPEPPDAVVRRIPVSELLLGSEEVILVHQGQDYRLRLTQNGKLILTK